ncbi:hypothetical protein AQUCO_00201072v1 [Aquilegia coerulea]|uniref:Disease resistance R13L4/SHOC-2-like LRR domain-containing protein n=1 Tax=Aquilegia coerulea TaxID=218851 RepID=A0A2G5F6A1_AQUCA|nr:hypothetical protein AQUCO_00201072v1 [Aquilegia coerulea]
MEKIAIKTQGLLICILIFISNVFCMGESDNNISVMENSEKEALYSAIQGFVGNWWNGTELFPDPCGWTPIQGVSCDLFDGLWYVTVLNIGKIQENSLKCTPNAEFRRHLFEFKHLKTLSFISCFNFPHQYPVSIPTDNWDKLAGSLVSLEFRSNPGLIGQIPPSFGGLTNLQSLVLQENGLTGGLPSNLGNLVSLQRIVLAGNKFTGQIPASFGGLTELLILDASRNSLTGTLPLTFGGLTSLLKLDMSNNLLNGMLPNELGNLKNLTLLDLRNNRLSGGLTKSLQEIISLEEMALSNNPIGGNLMTIEWQNLQNLVSLDLSYMSLTGSIPESMTVLRRLRFLGLNHNNLSGNLSPKLAALPSLSALYMNGNNLTGKLEFSEWFYGKMGRRFGAWSNPNLCYPVELMSTGHVPFGVKPCQEGVTLLVANSNIKMSDEDSDQKNSSLVSLGYSINVVDRSWKVILVKEIVIVLLINFIL